MAASPASSRQLIFQQDLGQPTAIRALANRILRLVRRSEPKIEDLRPLDEVLHQIKSQHYDVKVTGYAFTEARETPKARILLDSIAAIMGYSAFLSKDDSQNVHDSGVFEKPSDTEVFDAMRRLPLPHARMIYDDLLRIADISPSPKLKSEATRICWCIQFVIRSGRVAGQKLDDGTGGC